MDGADNGKHGMTRLDRVEVDAILLRRDLTALVAAQREMAERIRELAALTTAEIAAVDRISGRLAFIEEVLERTAISTQRIESLMSQKRR
jgi:K+/H+ antiporter YhaU regulatory subunit KhtT